MIDSVSTYSGSWFLLAIPCIVLFGCGATPRAETPTQGSAQIKVHHPTDYAARWREERKNLEEQQKLREEITRNRNYDEYLQWEGYTLGLWDGEGRGEIIAHTPSVLARIEQLQSSEVPLHELRGLYFVVNRGACVKVIQQRSGYAEILVEHAYMNSSRNQRTGWVLLDVLKTKADREAKTR